MNTQTVLITAPPREVIGMVINALKSVGTTSLYRSPDEGTYALGTWGVIDLAGLSGTDFDAIAKDLGLTEYTCMATDKGDREGWRKP